MTLMVTISGVRGIVSETLTPAVVNKYVSAFGELQHRRVAEDDRIFSDKTNKALVIVGSDSRVSGPWVRNVAHGVLQAMGFQVRDLGIVPTPTVQFIVQQEQAIGGLVITSSHNPVEWNGLKFIDADGLFMDGGLCKRMFELADAGEFKHYASYDKLGSLEHSDTAAKRHVDFVLGLPYIKPEKVAERKLKVCLDTVNGAGGPIMKLLLESFGCEVVLMNFEPSGLFAHKPEPIPEHLDDLSAFVLKEKADLGVATDPDVDRCVFLDETGKPIGEEYTLAMAVEFLLGSVGRRGVVCKNLSSSRAIDDIAKKYDCECVPTAVGEINVARRMVELNAVIGGEGNGGVMLPDVHIGRDAPVAAALALQLLAERGGTLSELVATLPQYQIVKLKAPLQGINPEKAVAHFDAVWSSDSAPEKATLNREDGLHISCADWWVHLRKSNTEPIIRVIGEGRDAAHSQEVCERFLDEIKSL